MYLRFLNKSPAHEKYRWVTKAWQRMYNCSRYREPSLSHSPVNFRFPFNFSANDEVSESCKKLVTARFLERYRVSLRYSRFSFPTLSSSDTPRSAFILPENLSRREREPVADASSHEFSLVSRGTKRRRTHTPISPLHFSRREIIFEGAWSIQQPLDTIKECVLIKAPLRRSTQATTSPAVSSLPMRITRYTELQFSSRDPPIRVQRICRNSDIQILETVTFLVTALRRLFLMLADENCNEGVEGYLGSAWVWYESERGEGGSLETECLAIQRQNTRQKRAKKSET